MPTLVPALGIGYGSVISVNRFYAKTEIMRAGCILEGWILFVMKVVMVNGFKYLCVYRMWEKKISVSWISLKVLIQVN